MNAKLSLKQLYILFSISPRLFITLSKFQKSFLIHCLQLHFISLYHLLLFAFTLLFFVFSFSFSLSLSFIINFFYTHHFFSNKQNIKFEFFYFVSFYMFIFYFSVFLLLLMCSPHHTYIRTYRSLILSTF